MVQPPAPPVPELHAERLDSMHRTLRRELYTGRPRASRQLWLAASAVVVVALIVGLVAGLQLAPGSRPSGASTDRYPEPIPPGQRARIETQCRTDPAWGPPLSQADHRPFVRHAALVALDRQGSYFSVVLATGGKVATCAFQDVRAHPYTSGGYDGPRARSVERPVEAGVGVVGTNVTTSGTGSDERLDTAFIIGRAGPEVDDVALVLRNGTRMHASLGSDGWWQAQYPDLDPDARTPGKVTVAVTGTAGDVREVRLRF